MFAGLVATEACTTMHLQVPPPRRSASFPKKVENVIQLLSNRRTTAAAEGWSEEDHLRHQGEKLVKVACEAASCSETPHFITNFRVLLMASVFCCRQHPAHQLLPQKCLW